MRHALCHFIRLRCVFVVYRCGCASDWCCRINYIVPIVIIFDRIELKRTITNFPFYAARQCVFGVSLNEIRHANSTNAFEWNSVACTDPVDRMAWWTMLLASQRSRANELPHYRWYSMQLHCQFRNYSITIMFLAFHHCIQCAARIIIHAGTYRPTSKLDAMRLSNGGENNQMWAVWHSR